MSILNKILLIGQMQIDDKQHIYLEYVSGGYIEKQVIHILMQMQIS